ncbi:coiled-coil domain-containing protein 108 [Plakobranchus ocellatus]|uniref:Coiled-coil domain-containing protein 108 n=1 Tax=Plakobranchus ocellatus TaxID=259542 RepID=A0AAV4CL17_9GAST|nr:coiled-coil domain-containing protein 108 [Plakobranchus ocellatus]
MWILPKCDIVNCIGNYPEESRCRVFRLERDESERQKRLDVLPPQENFVVDLAKFFNCEKHWGSHPVMIKLSGGSTRPALPLSVFSLTISCLPIPKPSPRLAKDEDQQLKYFLEKDNINFSFDTFGRLAAGSC